MPDTTNASAGDFVVNAGPAGTLCAFAWFHRMAFLAYCSAVAVFVVCSVALADFATLAWFCNRIAWRVVGGGVNPALRTVRYGWLFSLSRRLFGGVLGGPFVPDAVAS